MKLWRALAAALTLAFPVAASAVPITYAFTSGSASLQLKLNGIVVASASAPLDGSSLTFDAASASITDLDLLLDHVISFPRLLNRDRLSFSLLISDAPSGYSSSGTGSNPYSVSSGPLAMVKPAFSNDFCQASMPSLT